MSSSPAKFSASMISEEASVTVIEPSHGWRLLDMGELWSYRELLWVLGARDVRVRYKQTFLGAAWAILRPILTMLIFTVIFGRLAKIPSDGYPYAAFVYAGLLPWTFFASALQASGASLVGSAPLIQKVYFPRLIVPLASVGAALVDLFISTLVLLALMAFYRVSPSPRLLAFPLLLLGVMFAALGVGTIVSAMMVSYRDVRHLLPFVVQIWMYVTPVIYPVSMIPKRWHWLLFLNPMSGLVDGFRAAFLNRPFDFTALGSSALVSALLFVLGIAYFERVERRFADIV